MANYDMHMFDPEDDVYGNRIQDVGLTDSSWTISKAILFVNEHSYNCGLSDDFFRGCAGAIGYLKMRLGINDIQTVILADLVNAGKWCGVHDWAQRFGVPVFKMLSYINDIDDLVNRDLILEGIPACNESQLRTYKIPSGLALAYARNEVFVPHLPKFDTTEQFLYFLYRNFAPLTSDLVECASYGKLFCWVQPVIRSNAHLPLCAKALSLDSKIDRVLLVVLAMRVFQNRGAHSYDFMTLKEFFSVFGDHDNAQNVANEILSSSHPLIKDGVIELLNKNGMFVVRFADAAWDTLLPGCRNSAFSDSLFGPADVEDEETDVYIGSPLQFRNSPFFDEHEDCDEDRSKNFEVIKSTDIVAKSLYYNASDETCVKRLEKLLDQEHFLGVQKRLNDSGLRSGFACLFYGAPGTGKTETVLQLARLTGRNILQVNMANINDKYVGETEKNIKYVFDYYRNMCRGLEVKPILLFNEADGIFAKRFTDLSDSVEQMNNTVQNIILQEIEKLDGILIATTNLTDNLDSAFERRFIYKLEFHKPDVSTKTKIWNCFMPDLTESDARVLASDFDLSGGQIENILRKCTVDYVLSGITPDLASIKTFCKEESTSSSKRTARIGFGN